MRIGSVFAVILLAGCAVGPTLEDLESRALLTGNWAEVEKRENALARRQQRAGVQCPTGYVSLCIERFGDSDCGCLHRDGIRTLITGR
jgi:hypothetical protein